MSVRSASTSPAGSTAATIRSMGGAARQLALGRTASPGAVILGYHDVVKARALPGGHDLTVTADQLDSHISLLRRLGFTIVSFGRLTADLEQAAGRKLAALTFDDALVGVAEVARPILAEHGVTATVFATTGTAGSPPPWWPGARATLTGEALAELARSGWEVGSHTVDHRSLVTLNDDDLRHQLAASRSWLREMTGQPLDLLAYPSGHHDQRVRAAVAEAGYRAACTFLNGRVEGTEDPLRLPRLTMGAHSTTLRLAYHLLRPASSWPDHQLEQVGPASA